MEQSGGYGSHFEAIYKSASSSRRAGTAGGDTSAIGRRGEEAGTAGGDTGATGRRGEAAGTAAFDTNVASRRGEATGPAGGDTSAISWRGEATGTAVGDTSAINRRGEATVTAGGDTSATSRRGEATGPAGGDTSATSRRREAAVSDTSASEDRRPPRIARQKKLSGVAGAAAPEPGADCWPPPTITLRRQIFLPELGSRQFLIIATTRQRI